MSDRSDEMSNRGLPRCPGGLLFMSPSADLFVWILYVAVSLSVNLSLVVLGALYDDPEKCRVVKVPHFMMINGTIGLVLALMSIVVLWEHFSFATTTWFIYLHVLPAHFYGMAVLGSKPEVSWDSSSNDFCDYSICMFAIVSVFIMPVFMLVAWCIREWVRYHPE